MELEKIVKLDIPFSGAHNGSGFGGGNIGLPAPLTDTLMKRQKTEEVNIQLFYRLHTREVPIYIELTLNFCVFNKHIVIQYFSKFINVF